MSDIKKDDGKSEDVSFELSPEELEMIAGGTTGVVKASDVTTSTAFKIVNAPVAKPIPGPAGFKIVNAPVAKPLPPGGDLGE
jgi:hypothetical protein